LGAMINALQCPVRRLTKSSAVA